MNEQDETAIYHTPVVREATEADADRIRRLWDSYFGAEWSEEEDLIDAAVGDNEYTYAVVAVADSQIVGVAVAGNYPRDHFEEAIIPYESIHDVTASDNGYLNFSAVAPAYRGQGIHTEMVESRVEWLRDEAPTDRVFALSWQRDHRPGSERTFRALDWHGLEYVDEYYRRFSDRIHCPDCPGECRCDAIIFGRDL